MLERLSNTNAMAMPSIAPQGRIRTRPIVDSDIDAVSRLLADGFRRSTPQDWLGIFGQLATHPTPEGFPKYGYVMEGEGAPVGVILLVSSTIPTSDVKYTRCNLSSWYVSPAYRLYGHHFISRILKNDDVTYINVSPAPHTLPLLKIQGFSRYSNGQFFAATLPFLPFGNRHIQVIPAGNGDGVNGSAGEHELLLVHARHGCMSLWCVSDGQAYPFVFRRRVVRSFVPCAQLIYCRDIVEVVRFFRPLARYLARRGMPLVMMDANGRIPGLIGIYVNGMLPKYSKGPFPPRLGDLAYTESALFGV